MPTSESSQWRKAALTWEKRAAEARAHRDVLIACVQTLVEIFGDTAVAEEFSNEMTDIRAYLTVIEQDIEAEES